MSSQGDILIVDDEQPILDFMTEILSEEGYTVCTARDGGGALHVLKCHHPKLILLDIHMPGLTGPELLDHLHQHNLATVPIVIMTADAPAAAALAAQGMPASLLKPFNLDDLRACVARFITPPPLDIIDKQSVV